MQEKKQDISTPTFGKTIQSPKKKIRANKLTNSLTSSIINFIKLNGYYAVRINTQGQYDPIRKIFRKGMTEKGTPDIICAINGWFVSIEIKTGKDRQSDFQKTAQQNIEKAGGKYYLIHTFDEFMNEIGRFINR